MKKILLVTLDFTPALGGVSRMYEQLCRALPPDNIVVWAPSLPAGPAAPPPRHVLPRHRVGVRAMARPLGERHPLSVQESFHIIRQPLLAKNGWPKWRRGLTSLYKYLKGHVDTEVVAGQVLPIGTMLWLISFALPIRYSVFVHGMDIASPMHKPRQRWLLKKILGRSFKVLAANEYVANLVRELGISQDQIVLVQSWPGVRASATKEQSLAVRQKLGIVENDPVLVTVARLVKRKGHDIVLSSLEKVWQQYPNTHYVIIGSGPEEENLAAIIKTLTKPAQVHLLGKLSDQEVAEWLAAATMFIMIPYAINSGDQEGFGIVYLEAGLQGTPVIGSDHGGVSKAVQNEVNGLLVPQGNVEATTQAILTLLANEELRKKLGEQGRVIAQKYTPEKAAEILMHIYGN